MNAPASDRTVARGTRLWVRIFLAVVLGCVVVGAVATVVTGLWVGRQVDAMQRGHVQDALDLLEGPVRSALQRSNVEEVQAFASRAAQIPSLRVTVVLPTGEVVAESALPLPLANHSDRPEIRGALANGTAESERTSASVGETLLYTARRIDDDNGKPLAVLRVALPKATMKQSRTDLLLTLLVSVLVGLPVAGVIAWLVAKRIARPLEEMTVAATRMASGDFSDLPRFAGDDEATRLADALRSMGSSLSEILLASETKRSELDAILASMSEGVLAIDADARVLVGNRSLSDCLQLPEIPAPGTPLSDVCRAPALLAIIDRARAGQTVPAAEVSLPGHAGRALSVAAGPMFDADGDVSGAIVVIRDVTLMRRLEQMRLDFVANVSHELRTPLAATLSALETVTLLGPGEEEMAQKMMRTAMRHGRRMGEIVDDLLTLSKIESEGDQITREPVRVLSTLRPAASAVGPLAAELGVTIELPERSADVLVLANAHRLEQVWTNLLSNAAKYNQRGGHVRVTLRDEPGRREVGVAVTDTGPGIPAQHLERLFERFYRLDAGRSRDRGGTGLGLAIVKHIVRSHRGRVEVRSEVGVGTTFEVWLPRA